MCVSLRFRGIRSVASMGLNRVVRSCLEGGAGFLLIYAYYVLVSALVGGRVRRRVHCRKRVGFTARRECKTEKGTVQNAAGGKGDSSECASSAGGKGDSSECDRYYWLSVIGYRLLLSVIG